MARAFVPGKVLSCCLLAIGVGVAASLALPAQPPPPPGGPAAPPASPLDEPINWLHEAKHNFTKGVRHYSCTLIQRERVHGVLHEPNIILFTHKVQPFSVHMKWVGPSDVKGQEVVYVQGKNLNTKGVSMMRVHAKGIIGAAIGFIAIAPDDPRVLKHSKHKITEAGLGHMIEENLRNLQEARRVGKTIVRVADYTFDKRPCIRIETLNTERLPQFYCERSVLYLEKESKLPMRLENYDWRQPGAQSGELLEEFSYAGLEFNGPNLNESLFNK